MFIKVQNENDNVPLTESAVYYPSVLESSPANVKVLQLVAEDKDDDPLQRITYRITSGNPEGFFAINSTSGEFHLRFINVINAIYLHSTCILYIYLEHLYICIYKCFPVYFVQCTTIPGLYITLYIILYTLQYIIGIKVLEKLFLSECCPRLLGK